MICVNLFLALSIAGFMQRYNKVIPNSFKSVSKINYEKLNSRPIRLVGCYSRNGLIVKFLLAKTIIDQKNYAFALFHAISRPGIYLQQTLSAGKVESMDHLFLVVHCYDGSASSYTKKNMTDLHSEGSEGDDEEDVCYNFEVEKSQEQEDFEIFGFKINIQDWNHVKPQKSDHLNNVLLDSLVVESVSNQTFITREILPKTTISFKSTSEFREYFGGKLETQKCAFTLNI
ncbi:hypothetical protein Glove_97g119 [Diversispora epigaea]|uniref:Uncharacterized protein n=1 Tax=Diversispora epigaea TaxID=1348612 RepID=A0A397J8C6_9GLOM|nr:hypothetical protein Glove_97g119 [Diversispora epigaea]